MRNQTMKACVLIPEKKKVEVQELPIWYPGKGEVLVRIQACGVCGSDVHFIAHSHFRSKYQPPIPGHEASGIVEEVGEGVTRFQKGDRVVISSGISCGKCKYCLNQQENLCNQIGVFGFDRPGSFAEFNTVEERYLVHLPESIPFSQGAILADAVSTPYHAIRYRAQVQKNDIVAILGCGGLGIHAVMLARLFSDHSIVAIDQDSKALENAEKYGATLFIHTKNTKSIGKELKSLTGGVDVLLDFTGYYPLIQDCIRAMNPGGRIVLVGIGRMPLEFKIPMVLIEKNISILGSYGSNSRALPELIQLLKEGKINLSQSITSIHSLNELNDCIHKLELRNENPIRYVIQPSL